MCAGKTPTTLSHACLTVNYSLAKDDKAGDEDWGSRRGRRQEIMELHIGEENSSGLWSSSVGSLPVRHEILVSVLTNT